MPTPPKINAIMAVDNVLPASIACYQPEHARTAFDDTVVDMLMTDVFVIATVT